MLLFGLRLGNALTPHHLHQELVKVRANKNQVLCLIPFFDDDMFKPVQVAKKPASMGLATCLPVVHDIHHVGHLAGIARIHLTTRGGRKTFATLKIYQGVPKSQVMLATGHKP